MLALIYKTGYIVQNLDLRPIAVKIDTKNKKQERSYPLRLAYLGTNCTNTN